LALAPAVIESIKTGAIKRFVVMAGCDGRMRSRTYFEDVAKNLPKRYDNSHRRLRKISINKLPLGDINGIPRVLDAGQCNDSYSLAVVALTLKDIFSGSGCERTYPFHST
jgi:hydroxylamine reductase